MAAIRCASSLARPSMAVALTPTFPQTVAPYVAQIERALDGYTPPMAGCPDRLREAMRHSLLAGGKRLRPLVVLMAAEACGSTIAAAMPAACAVEMVHTYSLIHDDLPAMDDDDMRRGQPSCHAAFGESTAILAGDALLTLAFEILARDVTSADAAARCCAALAVAAGRTNMVGGQSDDLDSDPRHGTLEQLESIHRRKTGAMICVSLEMGGIIAAAEAAPMRRLRQYGEQIGLAFQIVDDILDLDGSEATLGKRTHKDHSHEKLTFPGLLGMTESRQRAKGLIDAACDAVRSFGVSGEPLAQLAHYILDRDR